MTEALIRPLGCWKYVHESIERTGTCLFSVQLLYFLFFSTRENLLSNPKQKWRHEWLTSASAPCPSLEDDDLQPHIYIRYVPTLEGCSAKISKLLSVEMWGFNSKTRDECGGLCFSVSSCQKVPNLSRVGT